MHAEAWLIVKDCMKLEGVADSLRRQYEVKQDELLSGSYSQFDSVKGMYQSVGVDEIAISLIDLSDIYDKKMSNVNNHIDTYNKALNTLNDIELFRFNKAISDEDLMLYDMELAKVMIKVGNFISQHHNIEHEVEDRTTKERFIKRIAFETKFEIRQNKLKGVL